MYSINNSISSLVIRGRPMSTNKSLTWSTFLYLWRKHDKESYVEFHRVGHGVTKAPSVFIKIWNYTKVTFNILISIPNVSNTFSAVFGDIPPNLFHNAVNLPYAKRRAFFFLKFLISNFDNSVSLLAIRFKVCDAHLKDNNIKFSNVLRRACSRLPQMVRQCYGWLVFWGVAFLITNISVVEHVVHRYWVYRITLNALDIIWIYIN